METRANYVAVGLFTLLAIFAGFAFLYFSTGGIDQNETTTLRVRIPGSASGLGRGSAVLFNGVKVGDVRRIYIDVNNPSVAIADTTIDRLTPITASTKAAVGLAGLTGQASIEINGGNASEPNILREAEAANEVAEIMASPSPVTNLVQSAQSILARADTILSDLEGFTSDARTPVTETLRNVEKISAAIGNNADGIDAFLANVGKLSNTLGTVSDGLSRTLAGVENLLKAVDPAKIDSIVSDVAAFTGEFRESAKGMDKVMDDIRNAAASFYSFSSEADTAFSKLAAMFDGVDPASVSAAFGNLEETSKQVRQAVSDVAKVTDRIGARADDVEQMMVDARELASRLNQASVRIAGVMEKVDTLLGSDGANSLLANAGETFASFKRAADTMSSRIGPVMDGLSRFTGQGLRDVEALVGEGRRALQRIESAISSLERNPQRLLTGGDGPIREFDGGRNRR